MCVMEPPGRKGQGTEEMSEGIIAEDFPKLVTDTKPQIQGSQRTGGG